MIRLEETPGSAPRPATTGCLVCRGPLAPLVEGRELLGSNIKGDRLHPFSLHHCTACGHIQKGLDQEWHDSIRDLYERDYFIIGQHINVVNGTVFKRDILAVAMLDRLFQLGAAGALLDIGCGYGNFLHEFAQAKPGWIAAGHELTDLHKQRVLAEGATAFYSGPLEAITERFDLITLNHVVEHLTEPVAVLRGAAGLLKPGGRMVVRVPSFRQVHTDLCFMEHCSHYTMQTLTTALALAGLKVERPIEGLAEIEIGVVAMRTEERTPVVCDDRARSDALDCLAWAESLPGFIREQARGRTHGIFGMGGAGLWLSVVLKGELAFIVDEDPSKQGGHYVGCPIVPVAGIPPGAVVFVTFNNPEASARLCQRLSRSHPHIEFVAAPPVLVAS